MQSKIITGIAFLLVSVLPINQPATIVEGKPVTEYEQKELVYPKPFNKKREKYLIKIEKPRSVTYNASSWVSQCKQWASQAGITLDKWAIELIGRESKCNPKVWNYGGSGACGIPQALPCSKLPNGTNTPPTEQLRWMYNYVVSRYGSWYRAVVFHNTHNWY